MSRNTEQLDPLPTGTPDADLLLHVRDVQRGQDFRVGYQQSAPQVALYQVMPYAAALGFDSDDALSRGREYLITERLGGAPDVRGTFSAFAPARMEYATLEGQAGAFTYDLASDTATPAPLRPVPGSPSSASRGPLASTVLVGANTDSLTFGPFVNHISTDDDCEALVFDAYTRFVTVGHNCYDVRTSAFCEQLSVGNRCEVIAFEGICKYVQVGADCKRVTLYHCQGSAGNPFVVPDNTTDAVYRNNVRVPAVEGIPDGSGTDVSFDRERRWPVLYGGTYTVTAATAVKGVCLQLILDAGCTAIVIPTTGFVHLNNTAFDGSKRNYYSFLVGEDGLVQYYISQGQ